MKLASLKNNHRDGELVVVNRALTHCQKVPDIAATLQIALDQWDTMEGRLQEVYARLNTGDLTKAMPFDQNNCHSPLPRAYQWADGSAYVNHVELVRRARGATLPESFWTDPLMYQGGSDSFIGPHDDIQVLSEAWGVDLEAEVAVITSDVPMGASVQQAADSIKLLMLVNDVSLRHLIPEELAKGFGFFQSKPASAFSPVAITPDELGNAWQDGRVHLPIVVHINDQLFGRPNAGQDMTFNFPQLIAHAAKTRNLATGTIIGSGTISNKQGDLYGSSIDNGGVGYACIAEVRMYETLANGQPKTEFLKDGDTVRIEMPMQGDPLFGMIKQRVRLVPSK